MTSRITGDEVRRLCGKAVENLRSVCYALGPVKRTLLVPVLLIVATSTGAALLIGGVFAAAASLHAVYASIPAILTASIAIGFLVVAMRSLLQPVRPALFVTLGAFAVFGCIIGTLVLDEAFFSGVVADGGASRPIPTGVVLHGEEHSLVVGERSGSELRDVLAVRRNETPRVVEFPRAFWHSADDMLIVLHHQDIPTRDVSGFALPVIAPVLTRTAEDVRGVYTVMRAAWDGHIDRSLGLDGLPGGRFAGLARLLVFSYAVAMVWTAARLSRWPLFNLAAAAAYLRLVFFAPRLAALPMLSELTGRLLPDPWSVVLPDLLWLFTILVSTIILSVLPSFATWQRDVHPEVGNP